MEKATKITIPKYCKHVEWVIEKDANPILVYEEMGGRWTRFISRVCVNCGEIFSSVEIFSKK